MTTDVILAALVAGAALYKVQDVYGRAYERRTERLRATREKFYAAAHAILENPSLTANHLRILDIVSRDVASGSHASYYFARFLRYVIFPIDLSKGPSSSVASTLEDDVSRLMRAAFAAMAERQIVWKLPMSLAYWAACRRVKHQPDQSMSATKRDFDVRLMNPV